MLALTNIIDLDGVQDLTMKLNCDHRYPSATQLNSGVFGDVEIVFTSTIDLDGGQITKACMKLKKK